MVGKWEQVLRMGSSCGRALDLSIRGMITSIVLYATIPKKRYISCSLLIIEKFVSTFGKSKEEKEKRKEKKTSLKTKRKMFLKKGNELTNANLCHACSSRYNTETMWGEDLGGSCNYCGDRNVAILGYNVYGLTES